MTKGSPKWMKLDNAAKIYPASMSRKWAAMFRLSATLNEDVDPDVLRLAQKSALARFPGLAMRLRRGAFWYYLEHIDGEPDLQHDVANPCARLNFKENKGFGLRVRYYNDRIAVEIFHGLTGGTGGLCFLLTLVAEYLRIAHGVEIPRNNQVLDCTQSAPPEELEDGYISHAGQFSRSRREEDAYKISGTKEVNGYINITAGIVPAEKALSVAHEKGATITELFTAVLILAIDSIQRRKTRQARKLKPVKINVPVNLRYFFPCRTMRNFASYINPGIEPKYGEYTLDEVIKAVHHHMGAEATAKLLGAKFSTNVKTERNTLLRVMPLFLKNTTMKIAFHKVGDRKTSSSLSNLGRVSLPREMADYVTRLDFILGPLSKNPVASAAIGYGGNIVINFTRIIQEPEVERAFFTRLVKLGIPVKIESNQRY